MKELKIASNSIMLGDFIRHQPDKFHFMLAEELKTLQAQHDHLIEINHEQARVMRSLDATIESYRHLLDCALQWRRAAPGNFSAESFQAYMQACNDLESAIDAFTQGGQDDPLPSVE